MCVIALGRSWIRVQLPSAGSKTWASLLDLTPSV